MPVETESRPTGSLGIAWALFAAFASHVLRDASRGTAPLLWPLPSTSVPRWVYYGSQLGLLWLPHFLSRVDPLGL